MRTAFWSMVAIWRSQSAWRLAAKASTSGPALALALQAERDRKHKIGERRKNVTADVRAFHAIEEKLTYKHELFTVRDIPKCWEIRV